MFRRYNDIQLIGLSITLTGVSLMALDVAGIDINFGLVTLFGLCFGMLGYWPKRNRKQPRNKSMDA